MLQTRPHLDEKYFVENFIGGLKEELQNMVLLTRPQNMIDAYDSASYKVQTLESIKKVLKGSFKTIASTTSQFNRPTPNFNSKGGTQVTLFSSLHGKVAKCYKLGGPSL